MHLFVIGGLISFLMVSKAWSACGTEGRYRLKSVLDKTTTVEIPLVIEGEKTCYHQSSTLQVKVEKVTEGGSVEFEVGPLEAEFEKVPAPEILHYFLVEPDGQDHTPQLRMMSFLCSGEIPIGAEALTVNLLKMAESKKSEGPISIFISTGRAAENITFSQDKKIQAKVFDRFLEVYESRTGEDLGEDESNNIYIPNVIASEGTSAAERKLYTNFFSTTNSSVNGCSKKFYGVMKDLLIDNIAKTQPFSGIELKKKKFTSKYRLLWSR